MTVSVATMPARASRTVGILRPRYEYQKIRQLIQFKARVRVMQRDVTCDEPGNTGMEVRGVVRAEYCPRKRKSGDSCPETENLGRGGRGCWDINEVFRADSRGDDEDDEDGNPSTFFVPTGGRRRAEVVIPSENDRCTN